MLITKKSSFYLNFYIQVNWNSFSFFLYYFNKQFLNFFVL